MQKSCRKLFWRVYILPDRWGSSITIIKSVYLNFLIHAAYADAKMPLWHCHNYLIQCSILIIFYSLNQKHIKRNYKPFKALKHFFLAGSDSPQNSSCKSESFLHISGNECNSNSSKIEEFYNCLIQSEWHGIFPWWWYISKVNCLPDIDKVYPE